MKERMKVTDIIAVNPSPWVTEGGPRNKRERVLAWARQYTGRPVRVSEFSGPWYPSHRHPERDQVVMGFVVETRTAWLLRHKAAGIFEVLGEGEVWFDDPPDRAINILDDAPDMWMPIPKEVISWSGRAVDAVGTGGRLPGPAPWP